MSGIDKIPVIIPSLNPTEVIVRTVSELIGAGFRDIIVVDDGSRDEHLELFERVGQFPECTVLRHPRNLGKGAAIKTAFSFCLEARPGLPGVVTMDGDGQHLSGDAVKCAESMLSSGQAVVIGARDFRKSHVPKRNALGNRTTALALRVFFGIKLSDTQTGLRGIPALYIPMMLDVPGNRFEYETNMLLEIRQHRIPFHEIKIETVYEQGSNERSHYRPFLDSLIIFSQLIKSALSSFLSFLVDIGLFWLAIHTLAPGLGVWSIPACTAIARVVSSFINFSINRVFVFRCREAYGSHLWRYSVLAFSQMLASAGVLWVLAHVLIGDWTVGLLTVLKMLVDAALFFANYYVQRTWVFRK